MTTREILDALAKVSEARRGQITEQWYTTKGQDGTKRKQGPYYVWTWSDQGKKHTARIPAKYIERARAEIKNGKDVERLINEFWRNAEAAATGAQKKTHGTKKSRPELRSVKPSR